MEVFLYLTVWECWDQLMERPVLLLTKRSLRGLKISPPFSSFFSYSSVDSMDVYGFVR